MQQNGKQNKTKQNKTNKKPTIPNAGEDVKRLDHSYLVGENEK